MKVMEGARVSAGENVQEAVAERLQERRKDMSGKGAKSRRKTHMS